MFSHKEGVEAGNVCRRAYFDGIAELVSKLQKSSEDVRAEYRKDIFDEPERYRKEFRAMLGWPLTEKFTDIPEAKKEFVAETDGVKIYRVTITLLGCVPFWGLLFVADENIKKPFVIACHGALGMPELISGIHPAGSTNYNDLVHRVMKFGANVFAPQLLLWDENAFNTVPGGKLNTQRRETDAKLKQLGSSVTALEIHGIERAIDYFAREPFVDAERIGMVGLSYGGFYTLFAAAADVRIKAAISSSFFNDRFAYNPSDWTWNNSGRTFTDVEVLSLICPRPIYIPVGKSDPAFAVESAESTFGKFREFAGKRGKYAHLYVFDGAHEFWKNDEPIAKMTEELMR